ncbi:hypothetical protein COV19_07495 [Candidatus Woesearchaeota archaeon CG10_big_fil_rev_8_21_14_0_10_44_13]|nr:MAG: hypothetical protein COV19_07495 [Candidatus Woesearchaeota archaeon CG10_big_fil_rev_8_21_14_0_10_44_13]
MKTIVVIRGKSNTGKTTTIKRALKEIFGIEIYNPNKDIALLFKHKDKMIAIISMGDVLYKIEEYFDKMEEKFDMMICACRTKGDTITFFEEKKNMYNMEFIDKVENNEEEAISKIKKVLETFFK